MRGRKNTRAYILGALILSVFTISLGFAAFSTILNISAKAHMVLDRPAFSVVFSSSNESYQTNAVAPTKSDSSITTTNGTINNTEEPTISNLSALFTDTGQTVTYTFYVHNNGKVAAYLNSINFIGSKTCTTVSGDYSIYVDSACNSIKMEISYNGLTYSQTTSDIQEQKINVGEFKPVVVTLQYPSDGADTDESFNVNFPNITLEYSDGEAIPNQILYAFGDRSDSSVVTYTDYNELVSAEGHKVFLKYEVDSKNRDVNKSVCVVLENDRMGCFEYADYDQLKSNLKSFFEAEDSETQYECKEFEDSENIKLMCSATEFLVAKKSPACQIILDYTGTYTLRCTAGITASEYCSSAYSGDTWCAS